MGRGAWWAAVHGVARSQARLSDFTFTFHFHALQKEMATHSSVLAWRIPGTGEPGGLPSMGSHRVGHDWSDLAAAASTPKNAPWSSHDNSPSQYMHTSLFNIERWDNQTSTHERMKFLPTSQHVQMTAQMDQRSKLKS